MIMLTMNGKNNYLNKIKERISTCRKRLDTLKDQGYVFSKDIYDDIASFETKIKHLTLPYRMWDNKRPMFVGIIGVFVIISAIIIFPYINPESLDLGDGIVSDDFFMNITLDNLVNNTIIKSNEIINGTATHSHNATLTVQVRINNGTWENVTGSTVWQYKLFIDDLPEGDYTLFFKVSDDELEPVIIKRIISIQKEQEPPKKPTVEFIHPEDNDIVSGVVHINGTAKAGTGEIQEVQIRFNHDEDSWVTAEGTTDWRYNWDTIGIENGEYIIEVRSYDDLSNSTIIHIMVVVQNEGDEDEFEFEFDDSPDGVFYFHIRSPLLTFEPGKNYTLNGYHKKESTSSLFPDLNTVYTVLEINSKPAFLNISLPEETLITPPDNKTYTFSIIISISENAPMNAIRMVSIIFTYPTYPMYSVYNFLNDFFPLEDFFPRFARILVPRTHSEITIHTGQW